MVNALLARLGLPSLRVGSPALSILEAAAQSDLRSSQDVFNLLNSLSLDRASGLALDRIGSDENLIRITEAPATGVVTITDTSFSRKSSRIYQGSQAPIIGTQVLYVEDASTWPASGSLYVGRGTTNYEGPLAYASKAQVSTYWQLNLSAGTTRFHNLGEAVTLAQGGNRLVAAGTQVQTPQGNATAAATFTTQYAATLPDGEVSIEAIPTICNTPGVVGNVPATAISQFVSTPFSGAAVSNPAPFTNGVGTEDDQSYRERIRLARSSRSRGTPIALKSGVLGVTALDENKRVLGASVVSRESEPVSLYIDDGSGYEEQSEGIAYEVLAEDAQGGEQYFQLAHGRPVAKAFRETALTAPFALEADSRLAFSVGSVRTQHRFVATDFRSIGTASAYEVVAAINANPELNFVARTAANGTKVAVYAKADSQEALEPVAPTSGYVDSNAVLGFPAGLQETLWLYKNDVLLNKDGRLASVTTKGQGLWAPVSGTKTLNLEVDGIAVAVTVSDQSFIDAGTGYVALSYSNSLASWATVFNYLIPGVTTTVDGSSLTLTSNLGRNNRAGINITGGSLLAALWGAGTSTTSQGISKDYSLDRNLGQLRLEVPLVAGDRLTAGSRYSRGFVTTDSFDTWSVAAETTTVSGESGAELWFVVDGAAEIINTGVGAGSLVTVSNQGTFTTGQRIRYAAHTGAFTGVQRGDWVILTDTALLATAPTRRGAYRIADIDVTNASYLEVDRQSGSYTQASTALAFGGLTVVRTTAIPQRAYLPVATDYTASSMATAINTYLRGATAAPYRTQICRVRTNTYGDSGDLAFVAGNTEGLKVFTPGDAVASGASHRASVVASHSETGTPAFVSTYPLNVSSKTAFDLGSATGFSPDSIIVGLRPNYSQSGAFYLNDLRWNNWGFSSSMQLLSGVAVTLRQGVLQEWIPTLDRVYPASPYALTARDQLGLTLDGDDVSRRFVFNTYRRVKPDTGTYGASNSFRDADNGEQSLGVAFGTTFDWQDFAVHMKARQKADGILWRYYRHGPEGEKARVAYHYPLEADAATAVSADARTSDYVDIKIRLPAGAARDVPAVRSSSWIAVNSTTAGTVSTATAFFHLPISSAVRYTRLGYTESPSISGTWAAGNTVSASPSGATGILQATPAAGEMLLHTITGVFANGDTLTSSAGGTNLTASGSTYGNSTVLTLTLPVGINNHGLSAANVIWMQSSSGSFVTGSRVLTAVTATTVTFADSGAPTSGAVANPGTLSRDTGGEVTLAASTVVNGDLINLSALPGLATNIASLAPGKLQSKADDKVTFKVPANITAATTLSWYQVSNPDNISFYPLGTANTLTDIAAAVNGIAGAPVTAVVYGTPSATISDSTADTYPLAFWYSLVDGINWVQTHNTPTLPAHVNFTFKSGVTAGLATNSDWQNEDLRLVPITAKNVSDYLASPGVSGLFSGAEITRAWKGLRPEITTATDGSAGSINISGGTANGLTAVVAGSAGTTGSSRMYVAVEDSEADGLGGRQWVSVDNQYAAPKSTITSSTVLQSISYSDPDWWLLLSATKAWKYSRDPVGGADLFTDRTWQVERQGNFICFSFRPGSGALPDLTYVKEGDWVVISDYGGTPGGSDPQKLSTLNLGTYRVVRKQYNAYLRADFWIENASAVEEEGRCDVRFLDYDSVMPGDKLVIGTSLWGQQNIGTWTVKALDYSNQYRFSIDSSSATPAAVSGPVAFSGGSEGLVRVYEAQPTRLIKYLESVSPNGSYVDLKFDTDRGYLQVGSSYGSVIRPLDKLALGLDDATGEVSTLTPGIDGYRHNTGLIEEVNKVVYGDEQDPSGYPGIAAAGAQVNINGPLVRRITISLVLRVKTGISSVDIESKVKSGVAAAVNKTPVGTSVAISDVISAAQAVNGVVAVTVLSPTYGSGNDLIAIQPYEKALVVDSNQDVLISFVGE
jgi:uncharacterized phage protein gp47/JayE